MTKYIVCIFFILSCSCNKQELVTNEYPKKIIELELENYYDVAIEATIHYNTMAYIIAVLFDYSYAKDIPPVNEWDFLFSHVRVDEISGNIIFYFDLKYKGKSIFLNIDISDLPLLYIGVHFDKHKHKHNITYLETFNGSLMRPKVLDKMYKSQKLIKGVPPRK